MFAKKRWKASKPPADAPMPITGRNECVRSTDFRSPAAWSGVGLLSRGLLTEACLLLPIVPAHLSTLDPATRRGSLGEAPYSSKARLKYKTVISLVHSFMYSLRVVLMSLKLAAISDGVPARRRSRLSWACISLALFPYGGPRRFVSPPLYRGA